MKTIVSVYFLFSSLFFTAQFRINAQFEIDSPRVKVLYTTIDEVIAHFGNTYTVSKSYEDRTYHFPNGLSVTWLYTDANRLIRHYELLLPSTATDAYEITSGKSKVRDVLRKFPAAGALYNYGHGIVHTKYMNYVFNPNWKYKSGVDSNAVITGFEKWSIEDDYFLGGISHQKFVRNNLPDENSARFVDSVFRLQGVKYSEMQKLFEKTKTDSYREIEFRVFDESKNDFGYTEKFGDARDNFYMAVKNDHIIFIVRDDRETRKVYIKDSAAYKLFCQQYKTKYHCDFEPNDKLVVTEQYCEFRYTNEEYNKYHQFERQSGVKVTYPVKSETAEILYKVFSRELRSLSTEMQVYGVRGLYFLKSHGREIAQPELDLIIELKNSGKSLHITYATGCIGHSATSSVKHFIELIEKGKKLPEKWEDRGF